MEYTCTSEESNNHKPHSHRSIDLTSTANSQTSPPSESNDLIVGKPGSDVFLVEARSKQEQYSGGSRSEQLEIVISLMVIIMLLLVSAASL